MPLSILPKTHFLPSSFKKKMATIVASTPPTHISPLTHIHSSPETNPPLSLFENCKSMDHLKQTHSQIIQKGIASEPILHSKIIAFCCTNKAGCMNYARYVFDTIPEPNVYIWNTMIKGYTRINCPNRAVLFYKEMLENNIKPDTYTFPFLLKVYTSDAALQCGKLVHAHVCKFGFDSNLFVQRALVCMYSFCGQIDIARGVFDMSSKTDVVSWNVMISGYNRSKRFDESRKFFDAMGRKGVLPTSVTLVSVLSACSKLKDLETGKWVHQYIMSGNVDSGLILENALIDMYAACGAMDVALGIFKSMTKRDLISWTIIVKGFLNSGQIDVARKYFDQMPERDSVSWTAMIDGYLRFNEFKEVLILFREMQTEKVNPDEFTMVSIVTACAQLGALQVGEWVKTYVDKNQVKNDIYVANALIDMYFKCGNADKALRIFEKMACRDKFTWTAMIVGFAINGQGKEALDMFSDMLRASIAPDDVTYIGVLCACTHNGLVNEGRNFFSRMTLDHGVKPTAAHYGCMVDLLGRAGHLTEALELIKEMPMEPNSIVFGALLGACRVHKNVEMAEIAAKELLQLEPDNGAVCVLLCNIYAVCNKFEKLREVRNMMMERGIKKTPGCSLIEMNGTVHEFVAGDQSHPQSEEIYSKLEEMMEDLKFAGYLCNTSELSLI